MYKFYRIGFLLSVVLTLAAFFVVLRPGFFNLGNGGIVAVIFTLAFAQLIAQLIFFLHLGSEKGPRWNLLIFLSTVSIIFIIIAASLWIMDHLNYNMTPSDANSYLMNEQ